MFAALVFAINVIAASAVRDCRDTGGSFAYQQEVLFDDNVNYYAQSLVDGDDFIITLSAAHNGFLGFGIAEQTSGSMLGADIVVAAMDSDGIRIRDYYVPYQGFPFKPYGLFVQRSPTSDPVPAGTDLRPIPDCENGGSDDWAVLAASSDTVGGEVCQMITLKRKLDTGDSSDRPLIAGTFMRVVYAFGAGKEPSYHGSQRAGVKMWIGTPEITEDVFECVPPLCFSKVFTLEKYNVPLVETTYVNMDFKIYNNNETGPIDEHMIYFEEVTDDSTLRYLHHLVVFGCAGNSSTADLRTGPYFAGPTCVTPLYVWAYGGDPLALPPEAGFSAGFATSNHYTAISINYHFTNHLGDDNVVDDSGVRIYFTTKKREHEAGVLQLGGIGGTTIPSNTSEFMIWTNQYASDGSFKRVTNRIDFWNFEWQLSTPVNYTIEPGDSFQTFCVFNTSKWKDPIVFGTSSFDEMCIEYVYYWPALEEFNELTEIIEGAFDTRIEFPSICSANDFNEVNPVTTCYIDPNIPTVPILPVATMRDVFNETDSTLNVEQIKFTPELVAPTKEVQFAKPQQPVQCASNLVQLGGGGNAAIDPVIIGASVAGGVLLLAAVALVLFRLNRKKDLAVGDMVVDNVKA